MDRAQILRIRSFNRLVAERIGALDDRFLDRGRPINEARLLWEIGPDGAEVRSLRARLGIDSGYLSRVLRSLEAQRLAKVQVSADDHRVRWAYLSKAGVRERSHLDSRSDALASQILETLTERQREALVGAMQEVERLLLASMVRFQLESPTSAAATWCFDQYFADLDSRFDAGFDPAQSISADAEELTPPRGALIVLRLRGQPVGCGALKFSQKGLAEVKRMWIAPSVRGLGLGRRLLQELEQQARGSKTKLLRLETNRTLREAVSLYRSAGYREVAAFNREPYAHHWFEKRLAKPAAERQRKLRRRR